MTRFYLFEAYEASKEKIARIGDEVRAEARRTGTTISYTMREFGDDIITEYPDGRRERRKLDGTVEEIPKREHSHDQ
jgi:hypothetical protein